MGFFSDATMLAVAYIPGVWSTQVMERTPPPGKTGTELVETVVIGGGQAGLATGYHLTRRRRSCVILEAGERIGDSWRAKWDSLRLFTPAMLSALPGARHPGPRWAFHTKDAFADYLEGYARRFGLDVRTGVRAREIRHHGGRYVILAGEQRFEAEHVVLATGAHREPRIPPFAARLDPGIVQLHSSAYRNPAQLRPGPVLVVGAGNSGAEIALEVARRHEVWLAGSRVPVFPVRPETLAGRVVMPLFFLAAKHVFTSRTPMGRRARPYVRAHAAPLIRVKPRDLAAAGVRRVGRLVAVGDGHPRLDDGAVLAVANVIWCTGFRTDFSWIDRPAFQSGDEPAHARGVIREEPGMYLVGQLFLHAVASTFIAGVGRDADHVAEVIATRAGARQRPGSEQL